MISDLKAHRWSPKKIVVVATVAVAAVAVVAVAEAAVVAAEAVAGTRSGLLVLAERPQAALTT